jgi:hypothetical protein
VKVNWPFVGVVVFGLAFWVLTIWGFIWVVSE